MTKKKSKTVNNMIKIPSVPQKEQSESCCEKRWNLVPLRFALGLMFLASGLPKLFSLIGGESQIPGFFAGLGIPLAGFFAWVVAISEVLGGIFLMLGFMTWWASIVLGIIMVVAMLLTSFNPINWGGLTKHLVYIAGLLAVMFGRKYFSVCNSGCCCKGYCK